MLRPSEKLALRPGERVNIVVIRRPDPSRWDSARIARKSGDDVALTGQGLVEWAKDLDAEDKI